MLHDVEQEGGLSHRRAGRNHEHVPRLEAVALLVQQVKPRGKSLNAPLAGDELFKAGDGLPDEGGQPWAVRAALGSLPYLEQAGFRGVHQGLHVLRAGKRVCDGHGRRVNDGTQNKLIPQGMQVMLEKGSGSGEGVQVRQPGVAPYGVQLVAVRQGLRHGNNIQRQIGIVAGQGQPPQYLMTRKEKEFIRHAERDGLGHVGRRVHRQQGQNALFRAGSLGDLPASGRRRGRRIAERSHCLVSAEGWREVRGGAAEAGHDRGAGQAGERGITGVARRHDVKAAGVGGSLGLALASPPPRSKQSVPPLRGPRVENPASVIMVPDVAAYRPILRANGRKRRVLHDGGHFRSDAAPEGVAAPVGGLLGGPARGKGHGRIVQHGLKPGAANQGRVRVQLEDNIIIRRGLGQEGKNPPDGLRAVKVEAAVKVRRDNVRSIGTGVPVRLRHGRVGIIGDNDAGLWERLSSAGYALHGLRAVACIGKYTYCYHKNLFGGAGGEKGGGVEQTVNRPQGVLLDGSVRLHVRQVKSVLPANARCLRGQDERGKSGGAGLRGRQPGGLENAPLVKLNDKPDLAGRGGMSRPAVCPGLKSRRAKPPHDIDMSGPDFHRRDIAGSIFFRLDAESLVAVLPLFLLGLAFGEVAEDGPQDELAHVDKGGRVAVLRERLRARADRRQLERIGRAVRLFAVLEAVRGQGGHLPPGFSQRKALVVAVPVKLDIEPDVALLSRGVFPFHTALGNELAERVNVAAAQIGGFRLALRVRDGQHAPALVAGAACVGDAPGQKWGVGDVVRAGPGGLGGGHELAQRQPGGASAGRGFFR